MNAPIKQSPPKLAGLLTILPGTENIVIQNLTTATEGSPNPK
jgi:hypothetical protein